MKRLAVPGFVFTFLWLLWCLKGQVLTRCTAKLFASIAVLADQISTKKLQMFYIAKMNAKTLQAISLNGV